MSQGGTIVEVFKTNITEPETAGQIRERLMKRWPEVKINFDLEDCDNILRVEGVPEHFHHVLKHLTEEGFRCEVLEGEGG